MIVEVAALPAPLARQWWVPGVIPEGCVTSFFAPAEAAKTTITVDLSVAMAAGEKWLGMPVRKGRTLWLDWDEDITEFNRRVRAAAKGRMLSAVPAGITYVPVTTRLVDLLPDLIKLRDEYPPDLIVLDSFNSAIGGDAEKADIVLQTFRAMREFGGTYVSIDHETHQSGQLKPLDVRRPFGSQAKTAQARSLISLARPDPKGHPDVVVLVHQKSSYARRFDPFPVLVRRDADATWIEVVEWNEAPFKALVGTDGNPKATKKGKK